MSLTPDQKARAGKSIYGVKYSDHCPGTLVNGRVFRLQAYEFHSIVAALGDKTPAAEAILRLRNQGLDRHDAVHAVASIFAKYFYETFKEGKILDKSVGEAYYEEVRGLTKEQWYEEFEPE
jgi:hypothetical protein